MRKGSLVPVAVVGAFVLTLAACSDAAEPLAPTESLSAQRVASGRQLEGPVWEAVLTPLNARAGQRAVTGRAILTMEDGTLTAMVDVRGVVPGQVHPQHIHGHDGESTCPTPQADADGDGLVSVGEGAPSYGAVMVPLTPFPTPEGTRYHYEQMFEDQGDLEPARRAIVVHGAYVDGEYVASLPVACGTLERVR